MCESATTAAAATAAAAAATTTTTTATTTFLRGAECLIQYHLKMRWPDKYGKPFGV